MINFFKKLLPNSFKERIFDLVNYLQIAIINLFKHSSILSSLYYLRIIIFKSFIALDANLSPEASPVKIKIFFNCIVSIQILDQLREIFHLFFFVFLYP